MRKAEIMRERKGESGSEKEEEGADTSNTEEIPSEKAEDSEAA